MFEVLCSLGLKFYNIGMQPTVEKKQYKTVNTLQKHLYMQTICRVIVSELNGRELAF